MTKTVAKIVKYKVHRSMKKLLLVGNGEPTKCFAIMLNKCFTLEDAHKVMEKVNNGF